MTLLMHFQLIRFVHKHHLRRVVALVVVTIYFTPRGFIRSSKTSDLVLLASFPCCPCSSVLLVILIIMATVVHMKVMKILKLFTKI